MGRILIRILRFAANAADQYHKNETKKSVGILSYRYTARTLGETHVSTDDLTYYYLLRREEPCHVKDIFKKEMY